jgi:hypothetical protein
MLLFCLSTPSAFPFEGVKVEATGKEKIEYLMVSFAPSSSRTGVSGTLKASEMAGVGFTTFTTSEPMFSSLLEQTRNGSHYQRAIVILF